MHSILVNERVLTTINFFSAIASEKEKNLDLRNTNLMLRITLTAAQSIPCYLICTLIKDYQMLHLFMFRSFYTRSVAINKSLPMLINMLNLTSAALSFTKCLNTNDSDLPYSYFAMNLASSFIFYKNFYHSYTFINEII